MEQLTAQDFQNYNHPMWFSIPDYMRPGLADWIVFGYKPGGFLRAIISNDFMAAAMAADSVNKRALWQYAHFLFNSAPGNSYGPDALNTWKGLTYEPA